MVKKFIVICYEVHNLGKNTAYISDCDDKVWTWEIIEA